MYISDLSLHNFRSYRELVLHCEPGITAFVGENGQGKTNIVEGIEYLSTFSSHRVSSVSALVQQGAEAAVIRARVNNDERTALLELEIYSGRANRARLNRGQVRPSEILGLVRTVVFAPEDLALVTGDPATRRKFLDTLMIQMRPKMRAIKADYEKVLRQRAALLKTLGKQRRRGQNIDTAILDVWDSKLVDLGSQIISARSQIVADLEPHVEYYYHAVSAASACVKIKYEANVTADKNAQVASLLDMSDSEKIKEAFIAAVHNARRKEIDSGLNLVGPHRDELLLTLGSLPAKGYASHGESWSYALALKLASWQVLRTSEWLAWSDGDEPILILDDVFAELDSRRRERLADIIKPAQQVFITAAVGDDLPPHLEAHRFYVHGGEVTADERK